MATVEQSFINMTAIREWRHSLAMAVSIAFQNGKLTNVGDVAGRSGCPCVAPALTQTGNAANGWVTGTQYGYGCALHDDGKGTCDGTHESDGYVRDWCLDHWCIVDPHNCDTATRPVVNTVNASDFFSYETCYHDQRDANGTLHGEKFWGNSVTGYETCSFDRSSYCRADENGKTTCQCKTKVHTISDTNVNVTDSGTRYGWGCLAHDAGKGSCADSGDTADGEAKDWCLDKWCIVDPQSCEFRTRRVGYTAATSVQFSYETCGTTGSPFAGNSWTGTVACIDKPTSFCTAANNADLAGSSGCPCLPGKKQTGAVGIDFNSQFITDTTYGYGCKPHDRMLVPSPLCMGLDPSMTVDGKAKDWCLDKWCIVDPNNCDLKAWAVVGTANATDMFNYETCDANFKGNSIVGTKKCADNAKSFCLSTSAGVRVTASAFIGLTVAAAFV